MFSRQYIVGVAAVALLIWGPLDHDDPWGLVVRFGYLILGPLALWFVLKWVWKQWRPDEAAEDRLEMLEKRLDSIQDLLRVWSERDDVSLKEDLVAGAKFMALYSMVQDLAVRAGVDLDDLRSHYEVRTRWWHDHHLQRIQDTDQATASRLDDRPLADIPTEPDYPDLFERPPSE